MTRSLIINLVRRFPQISKYTPSVKENQRKAGRGTWLAMCEACDQGGWSEAEHWNSEKLGFTFFVILQKCLEGESLHLWATNANKSAAGKQNVMRDRQAKLQERRGKREINTGRCFPSVMKKESYLNVSVILPHIFFYSCTNFGKIPSLRCANDERTTK